MKAYRHLIRIYDVDRLRRHAPPRPCATPLQRPEIASAKSGRRPSHRHRDNSGSEESTDRLANNHIESRNGTSGRYLYVDVEEEATELTN